MQRESSPTTNTEETKDKKNHHRKAFGLLLLPVEIAAAHIPHFRPHM